MSTRRAAVIGWPVSHSRSPLIHGHWLKELGIAGTYERIAVEPGAVPEFFARITAGEFNGCNVTLPHKEAAFCAVAHADERARRLGVVNTVHFRDGELHGTSTDGVGFLQSLEASVPMLRFAGAKVVMLGAGGAARAIAGALLEEGIAELHAVNRTPENAQRLARDFGPRIRPAGTADLDDLLDGATLLVNTTSLGMKGQPPLEINLDRLPRHAAVADIVYVPLETPLIRAARARGNPVSPGLGMLLHQAVEGFALWFGRRPMVTDELHDLVARDIDPTYIRS